MAESRPTARGAEAVDIEPGYRLAAAGRVAAEEERLTLLEQLYDPVSRRGRSLVQRGSRCLEVAAGRGSMAVWLAEQVGTAGQVVATDIDTRYLQRLELPNLARLARRGLVDSSRLRQGVWAKTAGTVRALRSPGHPP